MVDNKYSSEFILNNDLYFKTLIIILTIIIMFVKNWQCHIVKRSV